MGIVLNGWTKVSPDPSMESYRRNRMTAKRIYCDCGERLKLDHILTCPIHDGYCRDLPAEVGFPPSEIIAQCHQTLDQEGPLWTLEIWAERLKKLTSTLYKRFYMPALAI